MQHDHHVKTAELATKQQLAHMGIVLSPKRCAEVFRQAAELWAW